MADEEKRQKDHEALREIALAVSDFLKEVADNPELAAHPIITTFVTQVASAFKQL